YAWSQGCAASICDRRRWAATKRHRHARMGRSRGLLAHGTQFGIVSGTDTEQRLKDPHCADARFTRYSSLAGKKGEGTGQVFVTGPFSTALARAWPNFRAFILLGGRT